MLIGISPIIGPELLDTLYRMGHGDEIVLADAHFPGESLGRRVVRADGLEIAPLLKGIAPLFILDQYVDNPAVMMAPFQGDMLDSGVEARYLDALRLTWPDTQKPERMERFAFYERAKQAYAIVMTRETAKYGNIILKKGVTPC
ncbi:MAG: L-fucose mutarotase [Opitutales bacterium]|nr:L-fucose mutarotase [Opitutales bacterium]|tara:strand:+ start:43 stop:474 length:432 start_codon:yes stop_codon:yes gene_type:complete